MAERRGARDRFFDGRNPVRRAVAPQLIGRTLSINDPDGRAVARWEVGDLALVARDKSEDSMVFAIDADPSARLVLFPSAQRTALLAAAPKLRRLRRERRPRAWGGTLARAAFRIALIAVVYLASCQGIE